MYRSYSEQEKTTLIDNLVNALQGVSRPVLEQEIYYFYKADPDYGKRVADRFNLNLKNIVLKYDQSL